MCAVIAVKFPNENDLKHSPCAVLDHVLKFGAVSRFCGQRTINIAADNGHAVVNITNKIVDAIKKLDFVDIVGTAKDGTETYHKIVDLKPEMIFTKYAMDNMNGLDLVKSSKEKLENNIPIFNMIIDNKVQENEIDEMYDIIGRKLNSVISSSDNISNSVVDIINQYNDYKNNK